MIGLTILFLVLMFTAAPATSDPIPGPTTKAPPDISEQIETGVILDDGSPF